MDLTSTYMGMKLRSPLVPSASPLTRELDQLKRAEDAGAGAVVLPSVFEEQLRRESEDLNLALDQATEVSAEATSYFPDLGEFRVGAEDYLDLIRSAKEALSIPVIASLNGASPGGWTDYARQIESAGADALELNIYYIPTDPELTADQVEQVYLDILQSVKSAVRIPVAVKLSPFFTNMARMAKKLDEAGADALVLFNRFYQPDIDLEQLEIEHSILLSTPQARRLPLRWIAILRDRVRASLAATSGIHTAYDALKMVMAGADVTMLCSVLLRKGMEQLRVIEREMVQWLEQHEYESLDQARGSLSQAKVADPGAFERAQYMKILCTYQVA
ncbi:MAG: dihydroorotate dehydrogenase-like protein [Verrucomicrobia bacterium]|nr:MAG: dihydroorotate dehydrogenase-like protein [Verrucomicrobiota bacterium]